MESTENNSFQATEDAALPEFNKNIESPSTVAENNTRTNTETIEEENVKTAPPAPSNNDTKLVHLPLSRIKHIMKLNNDITVVPLECVFLVTKATELFVQSLAREACTFTQQNDKKTLQKRDIESAISQVESLIFLEETL